MSFRIFERILEYSFFFSTLCPFSIILSLVSKSRSSSRSLTSSSYMTDKMTSVEILLISSCVYIYKILFS
ncbi:hypothetical protein AR158_C376L [Paramecium bursaria Chlorella virus AR158]|uniref:hypothetical protein n=1 Tax=Paramecium bursaria Chlorella virus AR158 TaxID=380598 RepID=UPI00015AA6A5|nr:hypothetical protein AR158_C376L [Paramecium bursaria Chlorella virus AR158]ABU43921.1 hypothetical protein AR158_C376L [Paramecium bursaria Chlorella virus AR158]